MPWFPRFIRLQHSVCATLALLGIAGLLLGVQAVQAASIAQGYKTTDKDLTVGMVVSLKAISGSDDNEVERASISTQEKVVGIGVGIDDSLLTLTDSSAQVHVASSGQATAFVSDLSGAVKKGDYVGTSPVRGVLMRTGSQNTWVVGTALEDFSSAKATESKVQNQDGSQQTIHLASLPINIHVQQLSESKEQTPFLVLFGKSITGKTVSQLQVGAAFVIFLILLIVEGSIVYGAIYSSITALGRNPLAKSMVYRDLLQVSVLSIFILISGIGAIYVLLWL